jgi:hypothetical protein
MQVVFSYENGFKKLTIAESFYLRSEVSGENFEKSKWVRPSRRRRTRPQRLQITMEQNILDTYAGK